MKAKEYLAILAKLGEEDSVTIGNLIGDAIETIAFYADPGIYHAISFVGDPPSGEFIEDVSEDAIVKDEGYTRPMPGKTAREFLLKYFKEEVDAERL